MTVPVKFHILQAGEQGVVPTKSGIRNVEGSAGENFVVMRGNRARVSFARHPKCQALIPRSFL